VIQPETWKLIGGYSSKAWAALGPLVGVLVGAYLTGRRQRRDWLADNKKEEYRELVSGLTKGLSTYLQLYVAQTIRTGEDQKRLQESLASIMEITRSRLFIAKEVKRLDVVKRWHDLTGSFENDRDNIAFARGVGKLLDEILDAAVKDMAR
jgi:hypothetical protein